MHTDPYDAGIPLAPLTESELREIHEDPAFLAWIDGDLPESETLPEAA